MSVLILDFCISYTDCKHYVQCKFIVLEYKKQTKNILFHIFK